MSTMFDVAPERFQTLQDVLGKLQKFLGDLVRLTEHARLGDLFGLEAQNWFAMGQQAGRNGQDRTRTEAAIGSYFTAGLHDAQFVLSQFARSHSEWSQSTQSRRKAELDFLEAEVTRREAAADRTDPDSHASKAARQLNESQIQFDVAQGLSRTWAHADHAAVADGAALSDHVQFVKEIEQSRADWMKELLEAYKKQTETSVKRLNEIGAELAQMPPDSNDDANRQRLTVERDHLRASMADAPELAAIEGLRKLVDAASVPIGRAAAPAPQATRPPRWWKFRLPGFRRILWVSLFIAVGGEQTIMQQLTGSYLGLDMIPALMDSNIPRHFAALSSAPGKIAFASGLLLLGYDGVLTLLALVFGFIPLLLSYPVRYYLDAKSEANQPPTVLMKTFVFAVIFLLLALGVIAFGDSTKATLLSLPIGAFGKAIALPAFTLVLILGSGWIMHTLFTEGGHEDYQRVHAGEVKRLSSEIDAQRSKVESFNDEAREAQRAIVAAQHRHAAEDSFIAGIGDHSTLPATLFEKARLAAVDAFGAGYEAGAQERSTGVELKEGEKDERSFEQLLEHIVRNRMLDIVDA